VFRALAGSGFGDVSRLNRAGRPQVERWRRGEFDDEEQSLRALAPRSCVYEGMVRGSREGCSCLTDAGNG
jgi:hypothetical protein